MGLKEAQKLNIGDTVYIIPERRERKIGGISLGKSQKELEFSFNIWDVSLNGYRNAIYSNNDLLPVGN